MVLAPPAAVNVVSLIETHEFVPPAVTMAGSKNSAVVLFRVPDPPKVSDTMVWACAEKFRARRSIVIQPMVIVGLNRFFMGKSVSV